MIIYIPPLWAAEEITFWLLSFTLPSNCEIPGLCHQSHQFESPLASRSGQFDWSSLAPATLLAT